MKRFLAAIACLALLLTGCAKDAEEGVDTGAQTTSETAEKTDEKIYAVKDGAPTFTIVYGRPENATHADYMVSLLKNKTGINFKIATSPSRAETDNIIYVGLHDDVAEMYGLYEESISYEGYGAVYKDGDVYICGYNETYVGKAAKKFLSEMIADYVTKDGSGKTTEAYFAEGMFFMSNPTYEIKSPSLLGEPLSGYTVALGKMPDLAVKNLTKICVDRIGKRTGAYIRTVEAASDSMSIELVYDRDMELFDYAVSSADKKINVRFGGMCALYGAFDELTALCVQGSSEAISISKSAKETVFKELPLTLEEGADIRVMSANVLGTGLEENNQCPTALRAALMAEYVMALSPDSAGLQEYYGSYTADFTSVVSDKYGIVTFNNYGTTISPTIYLKDKYEVKDKNAINIKVEETAGDSKAQNYYFTWVVLEDGQGEQYIHANLHLEYRNDTLRLRQCEMINAELASVMTKYPNAVIAITGDYNSKISNESPIFDAIKGDYTLECAEIIAPEGKCDNNKSSFHTLCSYQSMVTGSPSALDHVMVSTDTASVKLHRIIYDELICHSSDHCPVLVDIARR